MQTLMKPLEHIPVVGKAAQAYAWFDNKVGEFGGGILKGAGSMVGGVLNMVTHPVETASGIYAMAEHVPVMNGLMPNPLKLAHAGADIIFSGADPKTRLETVIDPVKSLQDDGKFGKALVDGFIEPYKKAWSEGKYAEVAGRATFDIGSLFIGAGEANAAIKTGEVASVAGKTAEVANVAGKAGEAANVASKSGKAAEAASTAGKATEVTSTTGSVTKITKSSAESVAKAGKTTEHASPGSVNFMSDSDGFFRNSQKRPDIDPNGFFDVVAHGSPTKVQVNTHNGDVIVDHKVLGRLIQKSEGFNGQNIRLLSCSTGAIDEGIAQNLANKLNVKVMAPSEVLWATPKGELFISPMQSVGGVTIPKPVTPHKGEWRIFEPGGNIKNK
jgi:hypothetical protein